MLSIFKKIIFNSFLFFKGPIQFLLNRKKVDKSQNEISITAKGLKHLTLGEKIKIPEFCYFSGHIQIDSYTTLGVHNFFVGDIKIGRYCQIGAYVAIHSTNHPIDYPTTYINRNLFDGSLAKYKTTNKVNIGNDVWIGHGVIVLPGVTIGDGAIIAAGSVLTKSVEPYTIVAGNPAKAIRKRFSNSVISELLDLKWWNKPQESLDRNKTFFEISLSQIETIEGLFVE